MGITGCKKKLKRVQCLNTLNYDKHTIQKKIKNLNILLIIDVTIQVLIYCMLFLFSFVIKGLKVVDNSNFYNIPE